MNCPFTIAIIHRVVYNQLLSKECAVPSLIVDID